MTECLRVVSRFRMGYFALTGTFSGGTTLRFNSPFGGLFDTPLSHIFSFMLAAGTEAFACTQYHFPCFGVSLLRACRLLDSRSLTKA